MTHGLDLTSHALLLCRRRSRSSSSSSFRSASDLTTTTTATTNLLPLPCSLFSNPPYGDGSDRDRQRRIRDEGLRAARRRGRGCGVGVWAEGKAKRKDELDQPENPPLQRHHGSLHARLVGALPFQYPFPIYSLRPHPPIPFHILLYRSWFLCWLLMGCFSSRGLDILILVLLWFIFYNGSKSATEFYDRYLDVPPIRCKYDPWKFVP